MSEPNARQPSEKVLLERAAVAEFIQAYNLLKGGECMHLERHGDAPDAIVRVAGREIGVEVAHIYGTTLDARKSLGRAPDIRAMERGSAEWNAEILDGMVPLNEKIITPLNRVIAEKSEKRYARNCWLLVRSGFVFWTKEDFEENKSAIRIPASSFEQIWMLCGRDASAGILQLA